MKPTRRAFLATLGAAVAAGFAKIETAVLERPGPLATELFYGGSGGGKTEPTCHLWGVPYYEDPNANPGRLYAVTYGTFEVYRR